MDAPQLQIFLLGAPEARWRGELLQIPRRVTRMLLFYLAGRGDMVTRSELITVLWENVPESTGRLRLRETLNKLRSALPDSACLLARNDLVGLDPQFVSVDLNNFNQLVTSLGKQPWLIPSGEMLPAAIEERLRQAVKLWRAPRFMAGADLLNTLTLDQWFSNIVEQSEQSFVRILERLADHEIAIGNLESALNLINLALVRNNLEETLHERVVWLHQQMGNTQQAVQHYLHYQHRLQSEMGTHPGARLDELFQHLQDSQAEAAAQPRLNWLIQPSAHLEFVGRRKYLALLRQAYQGGKNFILLGESGQGKTRLLQEFVDRLQPAPRTLLLQCSANDQNLPLQPLIDMLRQSVQASDWQVLPQPLLQVLTPLFPELTNLKPELVKQSRLAKEQTRTYFFEALRQIFASLAASKRLLLVVDDAQWADEATLTTLAYLMPRPPFSDSSMVLLAARAEEETPPLRSLIDTVVPSTQVIHLGSLTLGEITEMAARMLGSMPAPALVERLSQDTGGNAFFVLETLRALRAQPTLLNQGTQPSTHPTLPLASRIISLLQTRLAALKPKTRALLEIAAVAGCEFPLDIVCRASGEDKEEIAYALDELEARILIELVSSDLPDISYRFIHDKVREAVLASLNPIRAQILHQRIADAIQAELGAQAEQQAAVLAQHYEAAGEWQMAFPWWVKAVERARQLLGYTEAGQAMQHAERIIERHFDLLDEAEICQLYRTWGEIVQISSHTHEMEAIIRKLLRLGERRSSALLQGTAYLVMTDLDLIQNHFSAGIIHAKQAISCLEIADSPLHLGRARTNLGVFQYLHNQIDAAILTFNDALSRLPAPKDDQWLILRAAINYHLGLTYTLNGHPALGYQHANQALADNQAAQLLDGQISAYSCLTLAAYLLGKYPEARQANEKGLELAIRGQYARMANYLHMYQAMVELAEGRLDALQAHLALVFHYQAEHGRDETLLTAYRLLGDTHLWLRDYPGAIQYYEECYQHKSEHFLSIDHRFRFLMARALHGEQMDFEMEFDQLLRECQGQGAGMVDTIARLARVMVAMHRHEWSYAQSAAFELLESTQLQETFFIHLHAVHLLAVIEMNLGYPELAAERLQFILQSPRQPLHVWVEVETLCTLIQSFHQIGKATEPAYQRLQILLAQIETGCTHLDFQPALQGYLAKVKTAVQNHQSLPW